jgi:hypothetical protein
MAVVTAADEVYMLRVHGRIEGQEYINVMHFQATGDNTDVIQWLLIKAWLCFVEQLLPASGNLFSLERMTAMRVAPTLGPEVEYTGEPTQTLVGAAAGDTVASFVSARCSIRCERAGKRGRGRISFAGVPEGSTLGSTIVEESPYWTALKNWLTCMQGNFLKGFGFDTHRFNIGVVSRSSGALKPPYAVAQFSPAISMKLSRALGSQTSRKVGHGS